MKSIVVQGKNVAKAIESGLKELNATQDEVSIKILDEGGLFRKAKVEITLDCEVVEKQEKEVEKKEEVELVSKKQEENVNQEKPLEKTEKSKKENKENVKTNTKESVNKNEEEQKPAEQELKEEKCENALNTEDAEKLGKEFLLKLFEKMNISATVESFNSEQGITFNASGEKVSNLIGKRGETLNAIQEVLSNVLKNAGYREKRVFFDVENYKNRREMSLINLAERMAAKAVKIGKPIKLERMSAYERKIIHTALQDMENVTSKSEGEEPNRRLVILPIKKD